MAVGVIDGTWTGPVKVSRRLAALRPIAPPPPPPRGVDPALWLAYEALRQLVELQEDRAQLGEPSGH